MKTIKVIILVLVGFLTTDIVFAQDGATMINNVTFDQKYTKAQIETLWGVPTRFKHDVGGESEVYDYLYGEDNLGFDKQFVLVYFDLKSDKFKINGVVGVGDKTSKFELLPNKMVSKYNRDGIVYLYNVFEIDGGASIIFYTRNDTVYRIEYDVLY